MAKKLMTALAVLFSLFALSSCASILEGDTLSVTPHKTSPESEILQSASAPDVSSYDELKKRILDMIDEHAEEAVFNMAFIDDSDILSNVERVCRSIAFDNAYGAYSVYYINSNVTQIVSYYEVRITINYRHTKSQIDSIVTAYSQRYLRSTVLAALEEHAAGVSIFTDMSIVTEDYIAELVRDLYRSNPLTVIALPSVETEVYTGSGSDRVIDISFRYIYSTRLLSSMTLSLNSSVDEYLDNITESTDAIMLLSLCQKLTDTVYFDIESAADPSITEQSLPASAYGALVNKRATSEGYALAFKVLCDKLGLECAVVDGRYNNSPHFWNIACIDGSFYHIDVSRCDISGYESAFLKSDNDIINDYWWDTQNYEACAGKLTYQEIIRSSQQNSNEAGEADQPSDEPGEDQEENGDGTDHAD